MAEQDDGAERTHEPTQRRLDEARREGRVLTSKEMMVFATMAAGTLAVLLLPGLGPWAAARWAAHLRLGPAETLDMALMPAIRASGIEVLAISLIVALPVAVAAVAAQAGMGGIGWTNKGFAFKPEKIDPLAGIKRMFSSNSLVELGMSVAKVVLLGAVSLGVILQGLPELIVLGQMPLGDASNVMASFVIRLFGGMTLMLAIIGGADLAWQRHTHTKSLRMTFDEVKRENREDNGSPELKGKLRSLQIEASRRGSRERAALPDVPTATAIITNPTHFAVALRYRPGTDEAPVIIATGRDRMAAQVIERARKAGVPVLRMPPLARALYFTGDIGTPIHEGLYSAVAAVLAHVWRVDRGMAETPPEIDLPSDLRFDARGLRS